MHDHDDERKTMTVVPADIMYTTVYRTIYDAQQVLPILMEGFYMATHLCRIKASA